ncbi:hypothetical protein BGW42_004245 [Actinomortierella wolfii]|nr:hypothetical protein BGW42_004245 [Actinomortierella wolfii]
MDNVEMNSDFAHAVLPILYADPYKTLQQHHAATQTPTAWRWKRLFQTLVACINTSSALRGLAQETSAAITPVLLPIIRRVLCRLASTSRSSINYLDHVAVHSFYVEKCGLDSPLTLHPWVELKSLSETLQQDFIAAQKVISRWIKYSLLSSRHQSVCAIGSSRSRQTFFWPSIAFWTEPLSRSPSSSLQHMVMFPHLQSIELRSIEPESQQHLLQFVQQHQQVYPGMLSRLGMAARTLDHDFSIKLLQSFGEGLRDLELYSWPYHINLLREGGPITAPEKLKRLVLPSNMHPLSDFDKYLFLLERLETLVVTVESIPIFKDARERKLAQRALPLHRLRHLTLRSDTTPSDIRSTIEDAIITFGDTLESLSIEPSFISFTHEERMSWAEPEVFRFDTSATEAGATSMWTPFQPTHEVTLDIGHGQGMGPMTMAFMDNTIPNLLCPRLTHVVVKAFLPALRILHLSDTAALNFSMWSLAACPALESLTLDISHSYRTLHTHDIETLLGRTGNWSMCCVPNLRELNLRGPWRISYRTLNAMVTQQQVDVVSPHLPEGTSAARAVASSHHGKAARRLPLRKLRALDASGVQAMTAMEIGRLVSKLPSLREVTVAVRADEMANLKLWMAQHGDRVDVRCTVREYESEYESVV